MHLSKYSILKCFFGQIWSQNLKFSKLTEIWYRYTLLYPCFELNVNFFLKKFTHVFWSKLVPKSENLYQGALLYVYHDFKIFLQNFCHSQFFGQIWLQSGPQFPNCKQFFCITTFNDKAGTWDEVCDYVMVGQNIYGMP